MKIYTQFIRVMKLTAIIVTTCILQVSASVFAQRITLSEKNASLERIIKKITKQTGYDFIADTKLIRKAKPVTIDLNAASIEETMQACLKDQEITFTIENGIVLLNAKENTAISRPVNYLKSIDVSGKVTNELGDPLQGAGIKIKNGSQSTVTDAKGLFTLKNVDENSILQISYIGYITQEIKVSNIPLLLVKLLPASADLNEVIVVGFGSQKRATLIGSVSQVSAKDVNNRPVSALSNALTGQLPGVTIIQRSGQPGSSGATIQVRGVGSFGASAGALVLVDGIPVNSFNDIDPNDVENISILKDASTAAIYGSRGC